MTNDQPMTNPNQPEPTKMELKKENGKTNGAFCAQKLRDSYSERPQTTMRDCLHSERVTVQSPYRASLQNQYCKMTRMRRRRSTAALSQRSVSKACVEAMPAPRALQSVFLKHGVLRLPLPPQLAEHVIEVPLDQHRLILQIHRRQLRYD